MMARKTFSFVAAVTVVIGCVAAWLFYGRNTVGPESRGLNRGLTADERSKLEQIQRGIASLSGELAELKGEAVSASPGPMSASLRRRVGETADPNKFPAVPGVKDWAWVDGRIGDYRSLPAGAEREGVIREISDQFRMVVMATGVVARLEFLEDVALHSTSNFERSRAVIACHQLGTPEVVSFLQRMMDAPNTTVRSCAVEGMAWVRGAEVPRARKLLVGGLKHRDAGVRASAALSIAAVRDKTLFDDLVTAITRESDPDAAESLIVACEKLDPTRVSDASQAAQDRPVVLPVVA